MACDLLPFSAHTCFFSFEQLIGQQMIRLQNSISKCLHYHIFSSVLSNGISEAHHAWILSCFGLGVGAWVTIKPIFLGFWLASLVFFVMFRIQLEMPHPLIVSILWCVCTHPIDPIGIHLLHCAHDNERTWTHDAVHDTFVTIAQDASFHVRRKQLHVLPSNIFNFSCWQIDIMFTKDGIRTLVDIVIANPT